MDDEPRGDEELAVLLARAYYSQLDSMTPEIREMSIDTYRPIAKSLVAAGVVPPHEAERLREGWTQADEAFDAFLDRYAAITTGSDWCGDLTPETVLAHVAALMDRLAT